MNNIWFTSDHHFGHTNIIKYQKNTRPFETLVEMHEVLIECWNKLVKPNDIVFYLGDFCFGRQNISIAQQLNGHKKLILGNHDTYGSDYDDYFERIYGALNWHKLFLTHIPIHPSNLYRCVLNVHGHLHNNIVCLQPVYGVHMLEDLRYFNVSCDRNHLRPFHYDEIKSRIKQIEISS